MGDGVVVVFAEKYDVFIGKAAEHFFIRHFFAFGVVDDVGGFLLSVGSDGAEQKQEGQEYFFHTVGVVWKANIGFSVGTGNCVIYPDCLVIPGINPRAEKEDHVGY